MLKKDKALAFEITSYHIKLFANELLRRHSSDSLEKLTGVLADARVDLNPHQIDAALFAFRTPFSRGAILADEVGLGKTIEAGLLLAQKWAETKRRLLVIVPANLRKQWSQELIDKFYLPTHILEAKTFNQSIGSGNLNPFVQDSIIISSYQFVRSKKPYVAQVNWDLIVIDEAHRLRNVYKKTSKIANDIKDVVSKYPKVLLTATPLQNSIQELYGLSSIVDEHIFGDLDSFRSRFTRLENNDQLYQLKERLSKICKRTLRSQVQEYISYTNRHAIVQEFYPSQQEQELYDLITEYLQSPKLYAVPSGQRQLITLILRKLLASSTRAIAGTLETLVSRLEISIKSSQDESNSLDPIAEDLEDYDELLDEWDDSEESNVTTPLITADDPEKIRDEVDQLKRFHRLAVSIDKDSKANVLLTALRKGFEASKEAQRAKGCPNLHEKAVIFTESRRTQQYLLELLEATEFAGKVVLFNGLNNGEHAKQIYKNWLERHSGTDYVSGSKTADMRAALIDYFKDEATIMIATEAAAEGVNLQFCNLVVNYDLPWNPQRIEQRIGRCHRYGQLFDVVVVNFLNKNNAADQRVYELLDEKFKLFNDVFGASDEVLGVIESGIDFEKRIAKIYQECRTHEQIQLEFDFLQKDVEDQIAATRQDARETLLNNFDQEVVEKVKIDSKDLLNRYNERLWEITKYILKDYADFDQDTYSFTLKQNPFSEEPIHSGPYVMGSSDSDTNIYRSGHPLAKRVLDRAATLTVSPALLNFSLSNSGKKITILEPLIGRSGWLCCESLRVSTIETEDILVFAGIVDNGEILDANQCRRLFDLPAECSAKITVDDAVYSRIQDIIRIENNRILAELAEKHANWFDIEMDKLDLWAEDFKISLRADLDTIDQEIKEKRRAARLAPNLPEKLEIQKQINNLDKKRRDAWRTYEEAVIDVETQKENILDTIQAKMAQSTESKQLFLIRWLLK
ncbi:MAG: DEAD/DEAH box helicase [Actinobacteria bacterium]|nr:DEAD/DEAH box helicase [Actinomycetota bacterium]MCL6104846.1 DEAD/DEAH box helicase [Actinomycetota bacterium]